MQTYSETSKHEQEQKLRAINYERSLSDRVTATNNIARATKEVDQHDAQVKLLTKLAALCEGVEETIHVVASSPLFGHSLSGVLKPMLINLVAVALKDETRRLEQWTQTLEQARAALASAEAVIAEFETT
jgi:hypothetical protein